MGVRSLTGSSRLDSASLRLRGKNPLSALVCGSMVAFNRLFTEHELAGARRIETGRDIGIARLIGGEGQRVALPPADRMGDFANILEPQRLTFNPQTAWHLPRVVDAARSESRAGCTNVRGFKSRGFASSVSPRFPRIASTRPGGGGGRRL